MGAWWVERSSWSPPWVETPLSWGWETSSLTGTPVRLPLQRPVPPGPVVPVPTTPLDHSLFPPSRLAGGPVPPDPLDRSRPPSVGTPASERGVSTITPLPLFSSRPTPVKATVVVRHPVPVSVPGGVSHRDVGVPSRHDDSLVLLLEFPPGLPYPVIRSSKGSWVVGRGEGRQGPPATGGGRHRDTGVTGTGVAAWGGPTVVPGVTTGEIH